MSCTRTGACRGLSEAWCKQKSEKRICFKDGFTLFVVWGVGNSEELVPNNRVGRLRKPGQKVPDQSARDTCSLVSLHTTPWQVRQRECGTTFNGQIIRSLVMGWSQGMRDGNLWTMLHASVGTNREMKEQFPAMIK